MEPVRVLLIYDGEAQPTTIVAALHSDPRVDLLRAVTGLTNTGAIERYRPDVLVIHAAGQPRHLLDAVRRLLRHSANLECLLAGPATDELSLSQAIKAGAAGIIGRELPNTSIVQSVLAARRGQTLVSTARLRQAFLPAAACAVPPPRQRLTDREHDVLHLLVEGKTNKEIGLVLIVSDETVKKHVQNIMAKLGAVDRTQAAANAVRLELVP